MARRPKFTVTVQRAILGSIRAGATRTAAAAAAGISYETLRDHASRNLEFSAALQKAEGQAETHAVRIVHNAMREHWQAAAWWLERRRADDFARRDRVDLEVYVRQRARELGLDEDEAFAAIRPRLHLVG